MHETKDQDGASTVRVLGVEAKEKISGQEDTRGSSEMPTPPSELHVHFKGENIDPATLAERPPPRKTDGDKSSVSTV